MLRNRWSAVWSVRICKMFAAVVARDSLIATDKNLNLITSFDFDSL